MIKDNDLISNSTRETQLKKHFIFKNLKPTCKDEYIKIKIDLPWKELAKDVNLAFETFGWYGMVHRAKSTWDRSKLYGGLGLNYNPDYIFNIPKHAQGFGQPRSTVTVDARDWINTLERKTYETKSEKNTYADCLGLRTQTDVTKFRSFPVLFNQLKRQTFQGRIAQIRAAEHGNVSEEAKEFIWHTDENNEIISRLLIPLIYDEDYFIEFKETGNRIYFEPGYAYHWNTKKIHRWNFNYHDRIKNRTCIVLGFSPWLECKNNIWSVNDYFNKVHPTDMILKGLVI